MWDACHVRSELLLTAKYRTQESSSSVKSKLARRATYNTTLVPSRFHHLGPRKRTEKGQLV